MKTVGDLIENKDYDYISFYLGIELEDSVFFGVAKSENGKLIALDGDDYSENMEVLDYEEWDDSTLNIKNGLTVVVALEKKGVRT